MNNQALIDAIYKLVEIADLDISGFEVESFHRGGNNRLFRLLSDKRVIVAKCYYNSPSDPRDRLYSEYSFLSYAIHCGLDCIPEPIASDSKNNIALYEYIIGKKPEMGNITDIFIKEAADFICRLNEMRSDPVSRNLANASDSGFSIRQHCNIIEKRLDMLVNIKPSSGTDENVRDFADFLMDKWEKLIEEVLVQLSKLDIDIDRNLQVNECCISPSDFGFHNAIIRPNGRLCFIDFEYAGWDDPAKMVCDFFCQPQIKVDISYFPDFTDMIGRLFQNPEIFKQRSNTLFPLFQIKWCCIMMNVFLPGAIDKINFANPDIDINEFKRIQLGKAEQLFESIKLRSK